MTTPISKTPQEAAELRISPYRKQIIAGYILEWQAYRAEGHPANPDFDEPTPENMTLLPDDNSDWNALGVIFLIKGKVASETTMAAALLKGLKGFAAEQALLRKELHDQAIGKLLDATVAFFNDDTGVTRWQKSEWYADLQEGQRLIGLLGEDLEAAYNETALLFGEAPNFVEGETDAVRYLLDWISHPDDEDEEEVGEERVLFPAPTHDWHVGDQAKLLDAYGDYEEGDLVEVEAVDPDIKGLIHVRGKQGYEEIDGQDLEFVEGKYVEAEEDEEEAEEEEEEVENYTFDAEGKQIKVGDTVRAKTQGDSICDSDGMTVEMDVEHDRFTVTSVVHDVTDYLHLLLGVQRFEFADPIYFVKVEEKNNG